MGGPPRSSSNCMYSALRDPMQRGGDMQRGGGGGGRGGGGGGRGGGGGGRGGGMAAVTPVTTTTTTQQQHSNVLSPMFACLIHVFGACLAAVSNHGSTFLPLWVTPFLLPSPLSSLFC